MRRIVNFANPCLCSKCHGCIQSGKPHCDLNCEDCEKLPLVGCGGHIDKTSISVEEFNAMVMWRDEDNRVMQKNFEEWNRKRG